MFDTHSQHKILRNAACSALSIPSSADLAHGRYRGISVQYADTFNGWALNFLGASKTCSFEILRVTPRGSSGTFDDCYQVDGVLEGLDLQPFYERILAVSPSRIVLADGRLAINKEYSVLYAETEILDAAMELGSELFLAPRNTGPKLVATSLGAPYRQDVTLIPKDNSADISNFDKRRQRRALRTRTKKVLVVLALCIMWPIGLFIWSRSRQTTRSDTLPGS